MALATQTQDEVDTELIIKYILQITQECLSKNRMLKKYVKKIVVADVEATIHWKHIPMVTSTGAKDPLYHPSSKYNLTK